MRQLLLLGLLVSIGALMWASDAFAHQDGCHRWHSCPSDNGSYVCGDLGYTSGCPGGGATTPPPTPPTVLPPAPPAPPALVGPADGATVALGAAPVLAVNAPTALNVFISVSTSPATDGDGRLSSPGRVDFGEMTATGAGGFSWRPTAASVLLRRPGTYYWQAHFIDCTGSAAGSTDCAIETAVRRLVVAPPAGCPTVVERRGTRARITFCPRTTLTEIAFRRRASGPVLRVRSVATRPGEQKVLNWSAPAGARHVRVIAIDAEGRRTSLGAASLPRR